LRTLIEPEHEGISIQRQCELVGLVRSMWYYEPKPERPEDLRLMRLLDEKYMERPYVGVLRMTEWLEKKLKEKINPKHVRRLWRTVKYEEVYLHDYATVEDVIEALKKFFLFYNTERQHQSLDYRTPQEVYE